MTTILAQVVVSIKGQVEECIPGLEGEHIMDLMVDSIKVLVEECIPA
jgi:hypothetical protein